jgi:adenylylsulfate kinase
VSWAIWITGIPGSGKSALARAAAETLRARGVPVKVLELDAIRNILTPDPTDSDLEREAVYRLLAFMAATLAKADVPVVVDATAHRRWRQFARDLIPRFAEVQIETVPGIDRDDGWAIWITGRPGSGKTTIARRVMTALTARGVKARIVDANILRRMVWPVAVERVDDLVHRAAVCLATLLVETGRAVIVDATAQHRRWRELARELIPRFAEIQLACPPEVCAERERAARWRLTGSGRGVGEPAAGADVDLILDYETALCPELTIHTDVQDCATATADVLFVAERFHRQAIHQEGRPPCE